MGVIENLRKHGIDRPFHTIVIHCSATRPHQEITAADIRRWHVDGNGWDDIGYHAVITRAGEIQPGRDWEKPGAHVAGHNAGTVGICLVGGLDEAGKPSDQYMRAQWISLQLLVEALVSINPTAKVCGHRDFPGVNKACPCFDAAAWWQSVRDGSTNEPEALATPSLKSSRTMWAGAAGVAGAIAAVFLPMLDAPESAQQVGAVVETIAPGWGGIAVVVISIGVMLYARWDDHRKGRR